MMIQFEAIYPEKGPETFRSLQEAHNTLKNHANEAFRDVVDLTGKGSEWLGWRRILAEVDREELSEILKRAEQIRSTSDIVLVAGIGGSYLGAKAVLHALKNPFQVDGPEILFTGYHMGARHTTQLIQYLRNSAQIEGKKIHLIVISKSGSTIETALSFRYIRTLFRDLYGEEASEHITAITGPKGGKLNDIVDKEGYAKFCIPDDVGGRFSVLTPVGLLPLAVAGIPIKELLHGAVDAYQYFEKDPGQVLNYSAFRLACYNAGVALDVIGSFEPEFTEFSGWVQQLFGESEGKEGKGLFPIGATYSTDLHSLGQMIQEGERNLIETFLALRKSSDDAIVPSNSSDDDGLEYLAGRSLFEINQMALKGTIKAHSDGGVPIAVVTLDELSAASLGALLYFYELTTAVYGYMLDVNPFDQPGVEAYKAEMRKLLHIAPPTL